MLTSRRAFFTGLVAAPAVLKLGLWMPVRAVPAYPKPDYAAIISHLRSTFRKIYGGALDLSPGSQEGQVLETMANLVFQTNADFGRLANAL